MYKSAMLDDMNVKKDGMKLGLPIWKLLVSDIRASYSKRIFHVIFIFPAPHTVILGGPDIFVEKGSTINITCSVNISTASPAYMSWFHENEVSYFDSILKLHLQPL